MEDNFLVKRKRSEISQKQTKYFKKSKQSKGKKMNSNMSIVLFTL